jgi:hypothetical protein
MATSVFAQLLENQCFSVFSLITFKKQQIGMFRIFEICFFSVPTAEPQRLLPWLLPQPQQQQPQPLPQPCI